MKGISLTGYIILFGAAFLSLGIIASPDTTKSYVARLGTVFQSALSSSEPRPLADHSLANRSDLTSADAEPRAALRDFVSEFHIGEIEDLTGNILFGATIENQDVILVLDLDGKRVRKVIDGPGNNSYPSWSPDGREFVFVSDREGRKQLFIARWDGADQRRLTTSEEVEDNPHWSRTGSKITYSADTDAKGSGASVMSISALGGTPQQITKYSGRQTVPKLSPDGRYVSYSTNRFWPGWDVCVFSLSGKNEKCVLTGAQTYCRQDYSPDGKQLAYSSGLLDDVDIGILDFNSAKQTSLTKMKGREYDATWSPDGSVLAFTAEDGRSEVYNLYLVSPTDKKTRTLVSSDHSIRFLSWTSAKTIDLEAERIREEENQ